MTDKVNLIDFFKMDRFVIASGIEIIEICEEKAICRAEITEKHLNADNAVQGGMLYTIADFTFAVLSNYLHGYAVTQNATINYIRPAKDCKIIFAEAKEITFYKHNSVCEVKVFDESSNILAVSQITGFIK